MKKNALLSLSFLIVLAGNISAQSLSPEGAFYDVAFEADLGYVGILHHTFQSGVNGTNFDYVQQGGQDILFPSVRLQAELGLWENHRINFLYQPLEIVTNSRFAEDVRVDDVTFTADTDMELRYSFPFWRLTYLYDFAPEDNLELAFGGALQFRNASISFKALDEMGDGNQLTVSQNLGPVPAIALRAFGYMENGFFWGAEATGLYASSAIINGSTFEFEGSILDASVQGGFVLTGGLESFIKLRFLGGTSKGASQDTDRTWTESRDTYGTNYLATIIPSLGFRIR